MPCALVRPALPFPALGLFLLALAPAAAGAEDARLVLAPGQPPRAEAAGNITVTLVNATAEQVEWSLRAPGRDRVEVLVEAGRWFAFERPQQVVPEARAAGMPDDDWHFFVQVEDVGGRAPWTRAVNTTNNATGLALRLVFPVNETTGNASLRLTRDVVAPGFALGTPHDINHIGFIVATNTTEYALATLRIRPAAGGEDVPHPTPQLALIQTFPVQGLEPDTAYTWDVTFRDWAGNEARSAPQQVRTAPEPVRPLPRIEGLVPAPNATLTQPAAFIEARFASPDSPVARGGVRLFVDLAEVQEFDVTQGHLHYAPPRPLGAGLHRVSVEVTNEAGGMSDARWSFTVQGAPKGSPGVEVAFFLAVLGGAVLAQRRRQA